MQESDSWPSNEQVGVVHSGLGAAADAGSNIDRIPNCRRVHAVQGADCPNTHVARVEADGEADGFTPGDEALGVALLGPLEHLDGGLEGLVSIGEEDHELVPHQLVHDTLVRLDYGDCPGQDLVEELERLLGIDAGGVLLEPCDRDEHHRQALQGVLPRAEAGDILDPEELQRLVWDEPTHSLRLLHQQHFPTLQLGLQNTELVERSGDGSRHDDAHEQPKDRASDRHRCQGDEQDVAAVQSFGCLQ
mmetsp:Transcript_90505/g.156814  ORF Transcript_90505/g.156814 Transcript_90505/m.156814 type:complete len:247 (+) Transcript_90505:709-1449(+)